MKAGNTHADLHRIPDLTLPGTARRSVLVSRLPSASITAMGVVGRSPVQSPAASPRAARQPAQTPTAPCGGCGPWSRWATTAPASPAPSTSPRPCPPGRSRPGPHSHQRVLGHLRPALGRLVGQDPTPPHPGRAARRRPRGAPSRVPSLAHRGRPGRGPARRARLPALVPVPARHRDGNRAGLPPSAAPPTQHEGDRMSTNGRMTHHLAAARRPSAHRRPCSRHGAQAQRPPARRRRRPRPGPRLGVHRNPRLARPDRPQLPRPPVRRTTADPPGRAARNGRGAMNDLPPQQEPGADRPGADGATMRTELPADLVSRAVSSPNISSRDFARL